MTLAVATHGLAKRYSNGVLAIALEPLCCLPDQRLVEIVLAAAGDPVFDVDRNQPNDSLGKCAVQVTPCA